MPNIDSPLIEHFNCIIGKHPSQETDKSQAFDSFLTAMLTPYLLSCFRLLELVKNPNSHESLPILTSEQVQLLQISLLIACTYPQDTEQPRKAAASLYHYLTKDIELPSAETELWVNTTANLSSHTSTLQYKMKPPPLDTRRKRYPLEWHTVRDRNPVVNAQASQHDVEPIKDSESIELIQKKLEDFIATIASDAYQIAHMARSPQFPSSLDSLAIWKRCSRRKGQHATIELLLVANHQLITELTEIRQTILSGSFATKYTLDMTYSLYHQLSTLFDARIKELHRWCESYMRDQASQHSSYWQQSKNCMLYRQQTPLTATDLEVANYFQFDKVYRLANVTLTSPPLVPSETTTDTHQIENSSPTDDEPASIPDRIVETPSSIDTSDQESTRSWFNIIGQTLLSLLTTLWYFVCQFCAPTEQASASSENIQPTKDYELSSENRMLLTAFNELPAFTENPRRSGHRLRRPSTSSPSHSINIA